ncbi:MAG: hypothetical protein K6T65_02225 [Peptococcaceae bacterium]|nr:hypothetical protein [Peptococcaceae bacterium]
MKGLYKSTLIRPLASGTRLPKRGLLLLDGVCQVPGIARSASVVDREIIGRRLSKLEQALRKLKELSNTSRDD